MKRLHQWFNHILPFGTILVRAIGHPECLIPGAEVSYHIENKYM